MISIVPASPSDICRNIAARAKTARLAANLSQQGLAERAGVPLGTLKRFERVGAASIELVVRIALALRMENGFENLFEPQRFTSIDDVLAAPPKRRRGMTK
jgi:transcriptional regulator with XRE-family HTH domain